MHKYKIQILICELFVITGILGFLLYQTIAPQKAYAIPGLSIPVGGFFLPGLFDIFTPIPFCGLAVTVAGPNPGVFLVTGTVFHRHFLETPYHVGDNMLGLAIPTPPCPPTLIMLGSSLEPGPGF